MALESKFFFISFLIMSSACDISFQISVRLHPLLCQWVKKNSFGQEI